MSLSVARTDEDADDRREHADRTSREREQCTGRPQLRPVREDRRERGNAEDDRRDERHLVRLEQVGRHTGAVTDVVADVVGDRRGVARVVFGDTGFDLADEVGADVGRLGEDAATDSEEQREQRTAESEPDQDRRARVLEDHDDHRAPNRPSPTVNMPATPPVRNATRAPSASIRSRAAAAVRTLPRTARLMPMKPVRPDRKQPSTNAPVRKPTRLHERERDGAVGVLHRGRREEHDDRERHEDDGDRLELPLQVGHRAFLNRLGDLLHLLGALILGEHLAHEEEADDDREQRRERRADQDQPFASTQVEVLIAALGSE